MGSGDGVLTGGARLAQGSETDHATTYPTPTSDGCTGGSLRHSVTGAPASATPWRDRDSCGMPLEPSSNHLLRSGRHLYGRERRRSVPRGTALLRGQLHPDVLGGADGVSNIQPDLLRQPNAGREQLRGSAEPSAGLARPARRANASRAAQRESTPAMVRVSTRRVTRNTVAQIQPALAARHVARIRHAVKGPASTSVYGSRFTLRTSRRCPQMRQPSMEP